MAAALTTSTPNMATTLRPSESQLIADPLNNLEALTSSTGNNYIFNYFFFRNDSVKTSTENAPIDKEATDVNVENDIKYRLVFIEH